MAAITNSGSASSSPTTRASCAGSCPTPSDARASTSSPRAADGDEALAACNEHRPDALTLDLHMPGLDGLGVLRALRAGKAEPVPVVVVSAFSPAHGARAVDALAEGAFDLVAKPAMGESLDDFTAELGRKVGDAAEGGKPRRAAAALPAAPAASGRAARPAPRPPRRRRASRR